MSRVYRQFFIGRENEGDGGDEVQSPSAEGFSCLGPGETREACRCRSRPRGIEVPSRGRRDPRVREASGDHDDRHRDDDATANQMRARPRERFSDAETATASVPPVSAGESCADLLVCGEVGDSRGFASTRSRGASRRTSRGGRPWKEEDDTHPGAREEREVGDPLGHGDREGIRNRRRLFRLFASSLKFAARVGLSRG